MEHAEALKRSFLRTYTGRNVYPLEMRLQDLHIDDIAHALSNQCRFAGHTTHFYSVAQHSVLVANYLTLTVHDDELALAGLLHDAAEAYLVDMPTPIKRLMPAYKPAEERIMLLVEEKFELQYKLDDQKIHAADMTLLATEARDLMGDPDDWASLRALNPLPEKICYWAPTTASYEFLEAFRSLTKRRIKC